jgi:RNA polymerase sigma factor for flagellar operon FliA
MMARATTRGRDGQGDGTRKRERLSPDELNELDQLWHQFKGTGAPTARERLILHYAPLVKYVVGRLAAGLPHTVERADLVSYGMFGLMDALDKFDMSRQVKFETYAISRIKGAIIDELRAMDWVPRSIRFKAREVEKAHSGLESKLHRAPTDGEVADHLGITVRELHDVVNQISFVSVMALEELVSVGDERGERRSLLDTLADAASSDPTSELEGQEMRGLLAAAINSLSEREKIVITLYYFEGLTLAEIGDVLGVTESRVCQIHTKAVHNLRDSLVERSEA